jgi:hypothetical protein
MTQQNAAINNDGFELTILGSADYAIGENDVNRFLTYTGTASIRTYDDETGFNRVWLDSVSGSTDLGPGGYVDLTYKRSGNLGATDEIVLQNRNLEGFGIVGLNLAYADGSPLSSGNVAQFASGQATVTVRATATGGAANQLVPRAK